MEGEEAWGAVGVQVHPSGFGVRAVRRTLEFFPSKLSKTCLHVFKRLPNTFAKHLHFWITAKVLRITSGPRKLLALWGSACLLCDCAVSAGAPAVGALLATYPNSSAEQTNANAHLGNRMASFLSESSLTPALVVRKHQRRPESTCSAKERPKDCE